MASLDTEQRRHRRVSLFQEIACEGQAGAVQAQAADLSVGGMFLDHSHAPFAVGDLVTVRFPLGAQEAPVVAEAEVHYAQAGIGFGVRFLNLFPADRERVSAFVDHILSRPAMRGEFHLRKSSRVSINVPVRVRFAPTGGAADDIGEVTQIITLSKHGACLLTSRRVDVGAKMLLETPGGREFKSSIVWVGDGLSRSDGQVGIQCRGLAQSLGFHFP
jgi:hypothetical protein